MYMIMTARHVNDVATRLRSEQVESLAVPLVGIPADCEATIRNEFALLPSPRTEVHAVQDPEAALRRLNEAHVDVVLADIGQAASLTLKRLCSDIQNPPVLLLADPDEALRASDFQQLGLHECLFKNELTLGMLLQTTLSAIERRRLHRDLDAIRLKWKEQSRQHARMHDLLSRELRTGLATIIGHVRAISTQVYGKPLQSVHAIEQQGNRLLQDMNTLFHLWRIEAGGLGLRSTVVNPNELLDEIFDRFHEETQQRNITVYLHKEIDQSLVTTDAEQLKRAMTQLVGHIVGSCADSHLIVRTGSDDASMHIEFNFETRQRAGLGRASDDDSLPAVRSRYGLLLAQRIVEYLGGRFRYESIAGAHHTYTVILPLNLIHMD